MANFTERLQKGKQDLIPSIILNDEESNEYHGGGFAIASVKDALVEKFYYLGEYMTAEEIIDELKLVDEGEFYLGMCSGYCFMEISPFALDNASAVASLARLHSEQ